MVPEPVSITTILLAGAAAVGLEAAKEATKDAYKQLKTKVGELFGTRATRAVAKLEDNVTRQEGSEELRNIIGQSLQPEEATQILPLVETLVLALKDDAAAKEAIHSRVGLDIEAGGNAIIRDIQGAREVAAKVRAKKDVTIDGLRMDAGRHAPGK
jgi:hypothetical protein